MKSTSIFSILALATSVYSVAVPNAMPNFTKDQVAEAIKSRRAAGISASDIPITNLFARETCVGGYCDAENTCEKRAGCSVCYGMVCYAKGDEPKVNSMKGAKGTKGPKGPKGPKGH